MQSLIEIVNIAYLQKVSVLLFLIVIMLSFLKLLFFGDNKERILQKLIGGFGVFTVAIISKNAWVISTSLFIGGLIIASEDFMKTLAAIMRADSGDIKDILRIEPATEKQVKEKKEEELEEIVLTQETKEEEIKAPSVGEVKKTELDHRILYSKIRFIEKEVGQILSKNPYFYYEENQRISLKGVNQVFDGVLNPKTEKFYYPNTPIAVEIKYFPNLKSRDYHPFSLINTVAMKTGRFYSSVNNNLKLLFVIVGDDIPQEQGKKIFEYLNKRYPKVIFSVFSYNSVKHEVQTIVLDLDRINQGNYNC